MIIDGKAIAEKFLNELKVNRGDKKVRIAAISVTDKPAVKSFVAMKKKYAESVGMELVEVGFEPGIREEEIVEKLKELSNEDSITGIIVELPLAYGYDAKRLLDLIPVNKDIDILSSQAQEDFYNDRSILLPPAVRALRALFEEFKISCQGKTAAVFGQSILIGKPIAHWLENQGAKVFRIDENTREPEKLSLQSDMIISGVGKPNLITGAMVKDGVAVVDFGFEKLRDKIAGDVEFESVREKASVITPVPGGMGPIVIASFLENAQKLAQVS